ncbi:MAG: hypothetical protein E6G67_11395 [Actinobacteria bacterium]|nr:MAG: hypothetical protein E6G67_11395 [Actinomycetota bacterium]
MEGVLAVVPLQREPTVRPYPFRIPVDGPVARAVEDARRLLARTPNRFDGPVAFCHGVSPEGCILRRAGRYSEALVVFEEPSLAYRLGFSLGVQLFVERAEGAVLFQLRGPSIGRDPLLWTASASGGLAPDETPHEAVLADAAEEIGLTDADLPGFAPAVVCLNDDTGSALVVYHAELHEGAEPTPDEFKVSELHWAKSPADLGAQVSSDTLACWAALERVRGKARDQAQ